jgi:hypothetical protein
MMWGVGWSAGWPDGDTFIGLGYGPSKGRPTTRASTCPAFNRLYEAQRQLPDGPSAWR